MPLRDPRWHWPERRRTLSVTTLVLVVATTLAATPEPAPGAHQGALELRKQAAPGKAEEAAALFEVLLQEARESRTLVELVLDSGPTLAMMLTSDTLPETRDRLLGVYWQEVIPATRGPQRLQAVNDCGVLLLAAGDAARAAVMLTDLDRETRRALEQADPASAAQFLVNSGRASAALGRDEEAAGKYLEALRRDPGSAAALASLLEAGDTLDPERALAAWASAARLLGEARRFAAANETLLQALELAASVPAAEPRIEELQALVVVELVRFLGAATVSREGLLERWAPGLARLAAESRGSAAAELAVGVLLVARAPAETRPEALGPWAGDEERSRLLARLLFVLAQDSEGEEPSVAATLYQASWALDRESAETALHLAGLLAARGKEADPDGRRLQALVEELFYEKHAAYRGLAEAAVGTERIRVLEQLEQLHAVLGSVFESQERWGSPEQVDSAVFQWQRAFDIRRGLAGEKGAPSPVLSAHLARAYAAADPGRWGEVALDHYIEAASGYLDQGRAEAADVILRRARELEPEAVERHSRHLDALDHRLDELRRQAPVGEPGTAELELRIYQRLSADPATAAAGQDIEVTVVDGEAVLTAVEGDPRVEEQVRRRAFEVPGVERVRVEAREQDPP